MTVSPKAGPQRVKAKFIGPLAIALAVILCVFALAHYSIERLIRDRDLAERSASVERLFHEKLNKDINLMMATMRAVMINPQIEDAVRKRNRNTLAASAGGLFDALRDEHRITHLYLTGPDLVSIYRFHSPSDFGDRIERYTTVKAQQTERPAHGLELGPMGTLTQRLVVPWRAHDQLLGYLEIGSEIEHVIQELQQSLAVDLLVLTDKSSLTQAQWQNGQALMKRSGDWNRFANQVALAQTSEQIPGMLDEARLQKLQAGGTIEIEHHGRSLHLAMIPINDASQRHIASLIVMRDITALESTFRWSMGAVMGISLIVAATVLGIFFLALGRVEQDYQLKYDLEHKLSHLDTEHRRILQLEKLSSLGTMVGGIAHQLNNPLVGVVNLAQLAEREPDVPPRTRELLHEIRAAGADCRDFVKRMLEFSKVSSFEGKPTNLADLIEDTVLLFRQAESRHLPVAIELPAEPVVLTIDPILIRHALFNLLMNAAQATSDIPQDRSPAIVIRVQRQNDAPRGLPGWLLEVSDHGRGMSEEVTKQVFVPFYTTRSDGTGLGLSVVQQVALLHDGHVSVSSNLGDGTRFAVWLPDKLPTKPPESLS